MTSTNTETQESVAPTDNVHTEGFFVKELHALVARRGEHKSMKVNYKCAVDGILSMKEALAEAIEENHESISQMEILSARVFELEWKVEELKSEKEELECKLSDLEEQIGLIRGVLNP